MDYFNVFATKTMLKTYFNQEAEHVYRISEAYDQIENRLRQTNGTYLLILIEASRFYDEVIYFTKQIRNLIAEEFSTTPQPYIAFYADDKNELTTNIG